MGWTQLQKTYKQNGIVLALGSGVSVGSGLPDWKELLRRLSATLPGDRDGVLFDQLYNNGLTLPVIASILEGRCSSRSDFIERIRHALYRDFPFFSPGSGKSNRRELVRHVRENNQTLRAVAGMCAVPKKRESVPKEGEEGKKGDNVTFEKNSHIHAIVTFNLDAVLQAYVYGHYEKRLLRVVERPSASAEPDSINIYHMHGYLIFGPESGNQRKEAADGSVITEQDYYDFFNNSMSMFNYTFLHLLQAHSCLFIGLSMRDENIRRLLHYSKMERVRALISKGVSASLRRKTLRHFAILQRTKIETIDRAVKESLLALGTTVLWIDGFEEIPEQLEAVYRFGGNKWKDVF